MLVQSIALVGCGGMTGKELEAKFSNLLSADLIPLIDDVQSMAKASRSENTLKAYGSAMKQFVVWCRVHNLNSVPATPATIALLSPLA